jgi:hypothetical protein
VTKRALVLLAVPLLLAFDLRPRMQAHWRLTSALQSAVIQGNLDVAREMAIRLADLPLSGMPEELSAPLGELRRTAVEISLASDLQQAAQGTAQLGSVCASCHAELHQGPSTHARSVPPEGWSEGMRMNQHQWAADWLWLGFVAPSQPAWDRGARELGRASFPESEHLEPESLQSMVRELATQGMTDRAAQSRLMGELLQVCAECHLGS